MGVGENPPNSKPATDGHREDTDLEQVLWIRSNFRAELAKLFLAKGADT